MTFTSLLAPEAIAQLSCSAPPYIQEILLESHIQFGWISSGYVLHIEPSSLVQMQILLREDSMLALLQAISQVFAVSWVRISVADLSRDIPVRDFLSYYD